MFTKRVIINLKRSDDDIWVRPLGDIHFGNTGCNVKKFDDSIKWLLKEDNRYTIGMGDYIDNVMAYAGGMVDKRWNPENVMSGLNTTADQIEYFLKKWEPIKDKTWGLLAGNHEWKTIDQKSFIERMCRPLGISYLGRMAFIHLVVNHSGKKMRDYVIFAIHGGYAGRQAGGAINRLKQLTSDFDANIYLMGHSHDILTRTGTRIFYDRVTQNLLYKKVTSAITGTFLESYAKGVDGYTEINPFEAKRTGTITIKINPAQDKVNALE